MTWHSNMGPLDFSLINDIPVGIDMVDQNGQLLYMNEHLQKLAGKNRLGTRCWESYRDDKTQCGSCPLRKPIEANGVETLETNGVFGGRTFQISHFGMIVQGKKVMLEMFTDVTERKRAEVGLKLFRTLIDRSNDAIEVVDPETGRFLDVNEKACLDLGYGREELLALSVFNIDPTLDQSSFKEAGEQLRKSGALLWEAVHRRKDGSTFPVEVNIKYVQLDRDYIVTVVRDITERKRTRIALQEREFFFRESQRAASIGSYKTDFTKGQWESSQVLDIIFGIDKDYGRSVQGWLDIVHPDDREMMDHYLKDEVIAKRNRFDKEYRVIRVDDKQIRWVHGLGEVEYDERGNILSMIGTIQDITERKRAEEIIARQNAYLQNLFENSTIPIAMLDKSAVILDINKAFESTFQYAKEETAGKNINDVIVPETLKDEEKELTERAGNKQNSRKETVRKRKDGRLVEVSVHSFPIIIDGKLAGTYGVYEDITERKELEKQFLHAQRLESIGTLAGGIAHDFNNILGILLGYVSILRGGKLNVRQIRETFVTMETAVQRGAQLAKQILTFARRSEMLMEPMSVNSAVEELSKMIHETFPRTINLIKKLDSSLPSIEADASQIHQALLNLCVNARDAMPKGGDLSMKTSKISGPKLKQRFVDAVQEEYICVTIADTGEGIDEATKGRMFEPFFTTKKAGKGTGLGLAVVFGVVKSHHGFVDVESTVGRGTVFSLYFPVPSKAPLPRSEEKDKLQNVRGGTESILIVEDELTLQELLKTFVEEQGYTVFTASDGLEAVDVFTRNKEKISLLFSDLGLPKLSGLDAFHRIKEMKPGIKTIFASGFIEPFERSEISRMGVQEFLQKPYDPVKILQTIREVLDSP